MAAQDMTAGSGPNHRDAAPTALEESRRMLDAAARLADLGYWAHDIDSGRVHWSEESCRVLGVPPGDRSRSWDEFLAMVVPDDRHLVTDCLARVIRGEADYRTAFRVQQPGGGVRHVEASGEVLRNEHGRSIGMVGAIQDITERKQLEEQYRQSQKMQAVGRLAGGIAHDFNNLLVVIDGYAELVAEQLERSHRSHHDLDQIRAATKSAASLTRQLLSFSRRQILQPQVLDLNQQLRRMHNLLSRVIGEHIKLSMKLSATNRVFADPGQMDQVIVNLAVNARDAMPSGGRLTIETADADPDTTTAVSEDTRMTRHVLLTVSDTGVGMDEATRARLFEPFFTTKAQGQGTGLGLATVDAIVKQSGGSISVISEPNQGSSFRIYLPSAAADAVTSAETRPRPRAVAGTETVLLLEDQAEVRTLIERSLSRHGYRVLATTTSSEALASALGYNGDIHILVTDVVLPDGSGRDVARRIVARRPSARVLYMSGYTEDAIVHYGILDSRLAFIQKPFTVDALLRKVREVLEADQPPLV